MKTIPFASVPMSDYILGPKFSVPRKVVLPKIVNCDGPVKWPPLKIGGDKAMSRTVTVSKDALLKALRGNRDVYSRQLISAIDGWVEAARKRLSAELSKLDEDDAAMDLNFNDIAEPNDYTAEYDEIIGMFELEVNAEVSLSQDDYRRFILNKWDWSGHWERQFMAYTSH